MFLLFSVTPDIDALNPAAALRRSDRGGELPLFVQQEPVFQGSLRGVIRLLIHCYLEEGMSLLHVYQNGAEVLKPDRVPVSPWIRTFFPIDIFLKIVIN